MSVATVNHNGKGALPQGKHRPVTKPEGESSSTVPGSKGVGRIQLDSGSMWNLKGRFKNPVRKPATLEDMDRAILEGIVGRL